jgi:hypothetical protein
MKRLFLSLIFVLCLATNSWAVTASDTLASYGDGNLSVLNANWPILNIDEGSLFIASGSADVDVFFGSNYRGDISPGASQFSQVQITQLNVVNEAWVKLFVRAQAADSITDTYICVAVRNAQGSPYSIGTTSVISVVSGTIESLIASESSTSWSAGDTPKCAMTGTTITMYRNDVALLSTTNGSYATGNVGFGLFSDRYSGGDTFLNNWLGGDISVVGTARHRPVIQ